jgi:hypothetical protein
MRFLTLGFCHQNIRPGLLFKGTVSRDFWPLVFFNKQCMPPRALIHGLKPLWIWIQIRWENWLCNCQNQLPRPDRLLKRLQRSERDCRSGFSGLILTTLFYTQKGSFLHKTTSEKVWLPWSDRDCRSGFSSLTETAKAASAVWYRPRKGLQRSDRGSGYSNLIETAEVDSAVW